MDCNWTRTHNHVVHKRTLNHLAKLAKWLSWVVGAYLYGAFDCIFFSCHVHASVWIHTPQPSECQGTPCSKHCGFTLKRVRDMRRTYSQVHHTDKYSQLSSIIWPVWLNGGVFVSELSGCGFESNCCHFQKSFSTGSHLLNVTHLTPDEQT